MGFQSTLPCGSDQPPCKRLLLAYQFQSTLPCGSDSWLQSFPLSYFDFNPRSLAGATLIPFILLFPILHFNPRSLAGATRGCHDVIKACAISIHAPLRERPWITVLASAPLNFNPRSLTGATKGLFLVSADAKISIHAPLRERRSISQLRQELQTAFQSTLPYGSDYKIVDKKYVIDISIHAPLRERRSLFFKNNSNVNFNPRSLTGATSGFKSLDDGLKFQSTLPYGSDY